MRSIALCEVVGYASAARKQAKTLPASARQARDSPPKCQQLLTRVQDPLRLYPAWLMPEEFCDVGRGVTLCYETFGDSNDPPILLVMGLATQMIAWHDEFCEALAERGFYVVRFDNRDIGRSTHFEFRPPGLQQLALRRFSSRQYTLSDMAEDAAIVLRELGISPAHVVGASMGGMIAQVLAAEHPESVRSLVSIMSTTGSRRAGQPKPHIYPVLLKRLRRRRRFARDRSHVLRLAGGS